MRPETALQRQLRTYLAAKGYRTVAVPNGATLRGDGIERAIQMASLKRDGLCVGFPDLIVFGRGRVGFIEVKVEGGRLSKDQCACRDWLGGWGHLYAVCRSTLDVDETLADWGWI